VLLSIVDDRGRVLIPTKVREWLDLRPGDRVWFDYLGDDVLESHREVRFRKLPEVSRG